MDAFIIIFYLKNKTVKEKVSSKKSFKKLKKFKFYNVVLKIIKKVNP